MRPLTWMLPLCFAVHALMLIWHCEGTLMLLLIAHFNLVILNTPRLACINFSVLCNKNQN